MRSVPQKRILKDFCRRHTKKKDLGRGPTNPFDMSLTMCVCRLQIANLKLVLCHFAAYNSSGLYILQGFSESSEFHCPNTHTHETNILLLSFGQYNKVHPCVKTVCFKDNLIDFMTFLQCF